MVGRSARRMAVPIIASVALVYGCSGNVPSARDKFDQLQYPFAGTTGTIQEGIEKQTLQRRPRVAARRHP